MIDVVNVWHHYGIGPILRDVSMRVEPGELVAVMGPNGAHRMVEKPKRMQKQNKTAVSVGPETTCSIWG